MNFATTATDILDVIRGCLGPACDYKIALTRGVPPAGCNSIAAYWGDTVAAPQRSDCPILKPCGPSVLDTHQLNILVTNICIKPDGGQFDWAAEQKAAECFYRDLEIVEQCLRCQDWTNIAGIDGFKSLEYRRTVRDAAAQGGGYAARIVLDITSRQCCV